MNREAPVQLRHKKPDESKQPHTLRDAPRSPVLKFSQDTKPTAPTQVTPELGLLSKRCQQQLLETTEAVISVLNRSLRLGFPIAHLEDRKRTLTRVARLWPALGPLLPAGGHLPTQAFFRHADGNSLIVSWPQARSPFHRSRYLVSKKPKRVTHSHPLVFPTCFNGQCWKCSHLIKVLFFLHLSLLHNLFFSLSKMKHLWCQEWAWIFFFKALLCFRGMTSCRFAYKWQDCMISD